MVLGQMDRRAHSEARARVVDGPPATPKAAVQQQFKDGSDINTIMRRFGVSGQLPQGMPQGVYGDFTGVEDLRGAFEVVERANARFY